MKYGVIGEYLRHSFSKEIHAKIGGYLYEIKEVAPQNVERFITERNFLGINVTIPYKEAVIPYLDFISENAKKIGSVNTILNKDGKLYGYNTDYMGMKELIIRKCGQVSGKKILVLGAGATAKTATAVCLDMGAEPVYKVTRTAKEGMLTYEEAYKNHTDTQIIINTTPVGMYPKNEDTSFDITYFTNLESVIDAVYNPIRTNLVQNAAERGIKAEGGLFMLAAQAVYASEIFMGTKSDETLVQRVFTSVLREKENIVLTGMPGSGKTSVGKKLADMTGRRFIDTDDEIVKKIKTDIPSYFEKYGEESFRKIESEIIKETAKDNSVIISTGGGCILNYENIRALRQNGRIYFLDRDLEKLVPTESRPLSRDKGALRKRYEERYEKYKSYADQTINANGSIVESAVLIKGEFDI